MTAPPFLDQGSAPARDDLLAGLGRARDRWVRLEDWVRDTYGVEGEALYFGRDTGWSLRFRRSGKALLTLMPRAGAFRALVVVGPSAWDGARDLELTARVRAAWDQAHPYPDGRWLWLDVDDDRTVDDIERMVTLKSPPPRRLRRSGGPCPAGRGGK